MTDSTLSPRTTLSPIAEMVARQNPDTVARLAVLGVSATPACMRDFVVTTLAFLLYQQGPGATLEAGDPEDPEDDFVAVCSYRTQSGEACAAGAWMDDALATRVAQGSGIAHVVYSYGWERTVGFRDDLDDQYLRVLVALQSMHDNAARCLRDGRKWDYALRSQVLADSPKLARAITPPGVDPDLPSRADYMSWAGDAFEQAEIAVRLMFQSEAADTAAADGQPN